MNRDQINRDLAEAIERRLTERREQDARRRDARRRRLAELAERRKHGLAARHRDKLARGETPHASGVPHATGPADQTTRPPGHPTAPTTAPTPGRPNTEPPEQTTRTPGQPNTPPPERTTRTPGHQNTAPTEQPAEHHGQRNTPTFREWLLAHADRRPRRSGRFLYRVARDAARLDGWNTPDELVKAMETYESGQGHGAPMSAEDRVFAAAMLYRVRTGVDPRGVDDRPVMAPVDPADGHGNTAPGDR